MGDFRVVFTASDYDRTVAFFRDVMGLEVLMSFEVGGRGTILLAADGQIEIFANDSGEAVAPVSGAAMAWEVSDAAATYDRLVAAGAELLDPPTMKPWGHSSFRVRGPDGWMITLFEVVIPRATANQD